MRKVLIPAGAAIILDTLSNNGFEAYVVGGCVRDSLLGITPKDWDICTSATPQEVEQCFSGRRIIETGIQHGTVTVVVGGIGFQVVELKEFHGFKVVINVFGQLNCGHDNICYTRYDALEKAFDEINRICASKTVAFPYGFGCGLAGGDWATVERLMVHRLWNCDVKIYLKE